MVQAFYHKAELQSFGSLGWPLTLAFLPLLVRHWRDPSLEEKSWSEVCLAGGEAGEMGHSNLTSRSAPALLHTIVMARTDLLMSPCPSRHP